MSFAALQVAAYEKQYQREQDMLRTSSNSNMNRTRTASSASEKSAPPSKVMIKEANNQLMLMFEKISSLESELESKDVALEDITSKYNLNNMNVKTLSERIRELEAQSIEKDKAHNAQLVSYQQQCQNQLNVMKEQCKIQVTSSKKESEILKRSIASLEEQISTKENDNCDLRTQITQLKEELDFKVNSSTAEKESLQSSILSLEQQISELQYENSKIKLDLQGKDDKFAVLLSTEQSLKTLVSLIGDIRALSPQLVGSEAVFSVEEPVEENMETAEAEKTVVEVEKISNNDKVENVEEAEVEENSAHEPSTPLVEDLVMSEPTCPELQIDCPVATETSEDNEEEAAVAAPADAAAEIVADEPQKTEPETVEPETVKPETIEPMSECAKEPAVEEGSCCKEPFQDESEPEDVETDEPVAEHEAQEAASEPRTDDKYQFEMVETPLAESLVASSMSGSSFVNVPSCEEVDSYQDISTSSPDTNPSSPNRSHSSTPTGIQEDTLEDVGDLLEPKLNRTQTSETEEAETLQETSDVQAEVEEVAAEEKVDEAPQGTVEITRESGEANKEVVEQAFPEVSHAEEEKVGPQVEVETETTEQTNEEDVGKEAAGLGTGVETMESKNAQQEESIEEKHPAASTTIPVKAESPEELPATSDQTNPTEPRTPVKPGFVFTVNPSIVPGSIIRTPEKPPSRPQASIYEETVVGTAEI